MPCDNRRMRRVLALVVMCGCSFALVRGPKPAPAAASDCTKSRIVPILDAVFTGVMVLTLVEALTSTSTEWHDLSCNAADTACQPTFSQPVGAAIFGALTAVGGASSWFGFSRVDQCREAQRIATVRPPPPIVVQPPPPPPPPATGSDTGSDGPPIPTTGLPVPGAP